MNFTVQVHNAEEGGFWAVVDEIPGCITQGETMEELEANLKEVIELALEGLIDDYVESLTNRMPNERGDATWTMAMKLQREKSRAKA
jgi:predicted RNase H-like HicB family nuclease